MKVITKNKRAYHDYEILKTYETGIVLKGHEVKSIKTSKVNISDAIIRIQDRELWILNMDIPLYGKASPAVIGPYDSKQKRKLLIHKYELAKLFAQTNKTGNTILPLQVFLTHRGRIKIKIGIAKRMRKVEKKQILKERDTKRQMEKEIKNL